MKTLSLPLVVVVVAMLPALAAGKASFPIKRSNSSFPLTDLKLLTFRTIIPSYSGVFFVELEMGTPRMRTRTAFDTLSPVTWLQIPECQLCFPVEDGGSFDPKGSYSFKNLTSEDPICSPPVGIPLSNGSCRYSLGYSKGFMGSDIISSSVEPKDAAAEVSLRVAFGCGLYNEVAFGEDDDSRNPISGVMGLAMGHPSSLLIQLRPVIMDRFSYCIPPLFRIDGADLQDTEGATLDFGPDAVLTGDAVQSTRLLDPTFLYHQYYMINVTNISVDGVRGFLPAGGMTLGIDSIAPYSTMFEGYYQQLRDVVVQYFQEKHGLAPLNETQSGFGLCYELDKDGGRAQFLRMTPAIMLQMEGGASLELQNVFQWFDDEGCLAIISVTDDGRLPNMLGVYQQMSYRFLFELNASKLSFSQQVLKEKVEFHLFVRMS